MRKKRRCFDARDINSACVNLPSARDYRSFAESASSKRCPLLIIAAFLCPSSVQAAKVPCSGSNFCSIRAECTNSGVLSRRTGRVRIPKARSRIASDRDRYRTMIVTVINALANKRRLALAECREYIEAEFPSAMSRQISDELSERPEMIETI